ncbi:thiamine transporter [Caldicoprobacter guelmensis]|uniref:energy-coupled thiamine transporter ThiT n=1 Tax=Caldicoprobacter guelmensis TaxID=1170224 RepID=UPI0019560C99|nr:energy-coupled thiamine transporter ThiT [Caldicoprobacter guelmensis]MBM7582600.1 thiamine transporter [Caldicoprobacter guelmensis]
MQRSNTRMLVEAGVMIALAQVLSYVVLFEMPQGGSVTAGSMIPIFIFALRWGTPRGLLAGMVYGILQFILGKKYSFHIVSILFDYVIAFGCLGLAGVLRHKGMVGVMAGVFMGVLGRFICHVISGVVVFASYAPEGQSPWVYSIIYNGSYLLPELIISMVIVGLLCKAIKPHLYMNTGSSSGYTT